MFALCFLSSKATLMEHVTNRFGERQTLDTATLTNSAFYVRALHERETQEVTLLCTQCLYSAIRISTFYSSLYTLACAKTFPSVHGV